MSKGLVWAAAGVVLLALAGCGKSTTTTNTTAGSGYGTPGDVTKADRTVEVHILPSLAYSPAAITVLPGETVAFKLFNDATGIHEFVLGDQKVQDDYERTMAGMGTGEMKMPDRSNVLNLSAGETKELAWTFPSAIGASVLYESHEPGDVAKGLKGVIMTSRSASVGPTTPTTMGNMTSTTMSGTTNTTMGGMGGTTSSTMGDMGGMGGTTTSKP
ncbi:MAG TPA: hypothetical protein VHT75_01755 [Acidimicrobiales bacterium]|jgi:uncharacterized cupredoxin-like copper-binding protein|nr:hypothetical protein [Acidimicrobiales bacterium]